MWNFFIIITTILVFCLMVQAQLQILVNRRAVCFSPFGIYGECVQSTNCDGLFKELQKYPQFVSSLYTNSICPSNDNRITFVCCPYTWMNIPSTLPKTYPRIYSPDCGIPGIPDGRIVGGINAPLGKWPWMVVFGYRVSHTTYDLEWHCGGSLISTRHVLTAAHCMTPNVPYIVRVGDLDLNNNVQDGATPIDVTIQLYYVHPHYDKAKMHNDIALLKLDRDLTFTQLIRPLCLPLPDDISRSNHVGTEAWVAGWGMLAEGGSPSSLLMNVQLPVVETSLCSHMYNSYSPDPDRIICVGKLSGGTDSCHGDSGGPLMIQRNGSYYSIGIVSYGHGCARPISPGVYTRTSAYLEWIESILV